MTRVYKCLAGGKGVLPRAEKFELGSGYRKASTLKCGQTRSLTGHFWGLPSSSGCVFGQQQPPDPSPIRRCHTFSRRLS